MTVSFQPSDLHTAASRLQPSAAAFAGWQVAPPDPQMYGQLVGAAATDAEPAVTEDLNELLAAVGSLLGSVGERLRISADTYRQLEAEQARLAGSAATGGQP